MDKKELVSHIEALGKWAAEDDNRVALVVCGELTDDSVKTHNALVGRTDKIVRALLGNAEEEKSYKTILLLTAKVIDNPFAAIMLTNSVQDKTPDNSNHGGLVDSLKDLLDALKGKLTKND